MLAEPFFIFKCLLSQSPLTKALSSLDSSKSYGRLLENLEPGTSTELFLPENDFKTSSTVIVSKKHQDFGDLETNQRPEPQTRFFFICSYTYELNIIFFICSYTYEFNIIYDNWLDT